MHIQNHKQMEPRENTYARIIKFLKSMLSLKLIIWKRA